MSLPYPPPVDQLLALDMPDIHGGRNYLALGLGSEHIPDLIRLATDEPLRWGEDSEEPALWGPIHAWFALGQLRAEAAVEPLLTQFRRIDDDDDEWAQEEMPRVFAQIGPAAVPALAAYLADNAHGLWARVAAASGVKEIGQRHPEARAECVAVLTHALEQFADNDPTLNGSIIADLLDLRAVESAPAIERAFAAERVDEMILGDWEDAQIELGLKATRERPRKPNPLDLLLPPPFRPPAADAPRPVREDLRQWNAQVEARQRAKDFAKSEQAERKAAKKSRKRKKK